MADRARLAAYKATQRIVGGGAYSNLTVPTGENMSELDFAFAEAITLGTVERLTTLEYVVNRLADPENTKEKYKILLYNGVYQILYMDRVPDRSACDETVKIADGLYGREIAGFVNAVLRNVASNKEKILKDISDAGGHIAASMNKKLYELLKSQYPEKIDEICASLFAKKQCFLRVNTLKTDADAVAALVNGEKINERTVRTDSAKRAVEGINKGLFFIQGIGSQRAVELLGAKRGDAVIDVCAAPGGKSLGAAIDMLNVGRIYSFDLHEKKLSLLEKSALRLGLSIIQTDVHDGRTAIEALKGRADKVICDVPCSGTGEMNSKPEIKYKDPDGFLRLYETQSSILCSAAEYLKPGGTLVYSTCSINKHENEEVLRGFLDENMGFSLDTERLYLPSTDDPEGFYTARITREN